MPLPESIAVHSWFGPVRIVPDPDLGPWLPARRLRGQRRYYRSLARDAGRFTVAPGSWSDYMHWHVDWRGMGNRSWRARRAHLAALFTLFRRLVSQSAGWPWEHQVWLLIAPSDSAQDAVYLHTPNPNADNFPNRFEGTDWDAPVPERLREFLVDRSWQFGRHEGRCTHFVVRPAP